MKKISLLIILLSVNIGYSQECVLTISGLLQAYEYNESDFESFAIQNGFIYNANRKDYSCENGTRLQGSNMMNQDVNVKDWGSLLYAFIDVELYLKFKEELTTNYEYRTTITEDGFRAYAYGTNKPPTSVIYLSTHTDEETGLNFYRIEIL